MYFNIVQSVYFHKEPSKNTFVILQFLLIVYCNNALVWNQFLLKKKMKVETHRTVYYKCNK